MKTVITFCGMKTFRKKKTLGLHEFFSKVDLTNNVDNPTWYQLNCTKSRVVHSPNGAASAQITGMVLVLVIWRKQRESFLMDGGWNDLTPHTAQKIVWYDFILSSFVRSDNLFSTGFVDNPTIVIFRTSRLCVHFATRSRSHRHCY